MFFKFLKYLMLLYCFFLVYKDSYNIQFITRLQFITYMRLYEDIITEVNYFVIYIFVFLVFKDTYKTV